MTQRHCISCSVKTMQGWGFANMLTFAFVHYPYLVCILFGMPSLHRFTYYLMSEKAIWLDIAQVCSLIFMSRRQVKIQHKRFIIYSSELATRQTATVQVLRSSRQSWQSFISVIIQAHPNLLPDCKQILLTLHMWPTAIALNYSIKNTRNDVQH